MARIHSKKYRAAERARSKAVAERQYLEESHQKQCPNCGAKNTACILYGLPKFSESLDKDLENGLIVLGGCTIFEGDPNFKCNECKHSWS